MDASLEPPGHPARPPPGGFHVVVCAVPGADRGRYGCPQQVQQREGASRATGKGCAPGGLDQEVPPFRADLLGAGSPRALFHHPLLGALQVRGPCPSLQLCSPCWSCGVATFSVGRSRRRSSRCIGWEAPLNFLPPPPRGCRRKIRAPPSILQPGTKRCHRHFLVSELLFAHYSLAYAPKSACRLTSPEAGPGAACASPTTFLPLRRCPEPCRAG